MEKLLVLVGILVFLSWGNSQTVVNDAKLDNKELKCLVCQASLKELTQEVKKHDQSRTVKIGGHRLDADGNYDAPKTIPAAKSELFLSDTIDAVCNRMDDYVRALWKSNGTLTLINMITSTGGLNPLMGEVDFVQDDDLNKSLKYYCEGIMEEFEEDIIKYFQNEVEDVAQKFCVQESGLCPKKNKPAKSEL
ncbi:protein seele [Cylas formicarius]|uniref:protein seele n=1 Tax=Cylas formicarius TaxID=197179 RepID=UPI0029585F9A|nr:protein seele [Cylas formicarius]